MTGADLIAEVLSAAGARYAFGVPGESILALMDAIDRRGVTRYISTRHEQAAASAADAYAKASGSLGVCLAHVGPGACNLVLGVASAFKDSSPILAITGNQSQAKLGRDCWHELDQIALFRPITKWNTRIRTPDEVPRVMRLAIERALSGRSGPVHIDVPNDVATGEVKSKEFSHIGDVREWIRPEPGMAQLQEAARLLAAAKRPIIFAGGGVVLSGATQELVSLAERSTLPVVTTAQGRGSIPEDHTLSVGTSGQFGTTTATQALKDSDLILAIGNRFSDVSTQNWTAIGPSAKIIQVDIDPSEIGRQYPVDLAILADARSFLTRFLELVPGDSSGGRAERSRHLATQRDAERARFLEGATDAVPIKPQRVVQAIAAALPRNAILTVGAGNHAQWIGRVCVFEPRSYLKSVGLGAMGFALPAAIGAKLACPERPVVAIAGDGDFAMVMQELETAVRENIPIIVVIFNDNAYGIIRQTQRSYYAGRIVGTELTNPRFDRFAELLGARGRRIEQPDEIEPALGEMLACGRPAVLDIMIDREETPQHRLYE